MIHHLHIRNYKSVRELDLDCKRVNIFIGEPNTGKTNVLEAVALADLGALGEFKTVFRVESPRSLFFRETVTEGIKVDLDGLSIEASLATSKNELDIKLQRPNKGCIRVGIINGLVRHTEARDEEVIDAIKIPHVGYYLYENSSAPVVSGLESLASPFGRNLGHLVSVNKNARATLANFFSSSCFRPLVDRSQNRILLAVEEDGTLVTLPYESSSETLRRMAFHTLAIETNRDAVLIFDEPEAHAFPPYTKTLAERIALDDQSNQFFLTTHSPYMLDALLSKTPASDLKVVLCRMEDFETKAYALDQEQIDQIKDWSMDAFFNFDRLLPEAVA